VKVNGLDRTKDDYIQRACKKLFTAKTFQDVLHETKEYVCRCELIKNKTNLPYYYFSAFDQLEKLGIFKNLKAKIDIDKSPKASSTGYIVTFEGEELSRITGTIGTEIGQNDGSLTTELVSPNIFGRGERLSINYSYSYIKATELNVKLLKPFYHTAYGDYEPEYVLLLELYLDLNFCY
jgi:outer membrane protein insertion porin family